MMLREADRHLPLGLLSSYAAGSIGPASAIAIAHHALHCRLCAERLGVLNAVGGSLLEACEQADIDSTSLDRVLARLDERETDRVHVAAPVYGPDVQILPEALRAPYVNAVNTRGWRFAGPGLRSLDLDLLGARQAGETAQILKIEPGYGAPLHTHDAVELTLVLDGAFDDETGHYGIGDLGVGTPDLTHRPIAVVGRTCIAYAVTKAPLRLTGMLGWVQNLLFPST